MRNLYKKKGVSSKRYPSQVLLQPSCCKVCSLHHSVNLTISYGLSFMLFNPWSCPFVVLTIVLVPSLYRPCVAVLSLFRLTSPSWRCPWLHPEVSTSSSWGASWFFIPKKSVVILNQPASLPVASALLQHPSLRYPDHVNSSWIPALSSWNSHRIRGYPCRYACFLPTPLRLPFCIVFTSDISNSYVWCIRLLRKTYKLTNWIILKTLFT